jgi:hypothetical protein
MSLPAVDIGIMAEHLSSHEGVINKLKMYYGSVNNPVLRKLLNLNINTLRNHVVVMLALIDPERNKEVHLPDMESYHLHISEGKLTKLDKDIALEARAAAKLMGSNNFNSALMMKDINVKNIHLQMSYQDITMQMLYDNFLKGMNGEFVPKVSKEMQRLTLQKYLHVKDE